MYNWKGFLIYLHSYFHLTNILKGLSYAFGMMTNYGLLKYHINTNVVQDRIQDMGPSDDPRK